MDTPKTDEELYAEAMASVTPEALARMDRLMAEIKGTEAIIHAVPKIMAYTGPKERRSKHRNAKRTKYRKHRGN